MLLFPESVVFSVAFYGLAGTLYAVQHAFGHEEDTEKETMNLLRNETLRRWTRQPFFYFLAALALALPLAALHRDSFA